MYICIATSLNKILFTPILQGTCAIFYLSRSHDLISRSHDLLVFPTTNYARSYHLTFIMSLYLLLFTQFLSDCHAAGTFTVILQSLKNIYVIC